MWAGGGWRSQPVLRHGCTKGSESVTASARVEVGALSWVLQQISAKHGQEHDGTELQHCYFALIQAEKCGLYLPWYCIGNSARPQYQRAIGISLTPCASLQSPWLLFSQLKEWMNSLRSQISATVFLSLFLQTNLGWSIHQMLALFYVYARKNFLVQLLTSFHISVVSLLSKCIPLHYNLSLASHFVFSRTQR